MKEIWETISEYEGYYEVSNMGRVRSVDRIIKYQQYNGHSTYTTERKFKGEVLQLSDNGKGYKQVILCKNGRRKAHYVHRLVAEAFVPNPKGLVEVNHKDFDTANNSSKNLMWVTHKFNQNYSAAAGRFRMSERRRKQMSLLKRGSNHHNVNLAEETVREIKLLLKDKELTQEEISDRFNVSRSCICHISSGNTWRHVEVDQ